MASLYEKRAEIVGKLKEYQKELNGSDTVSEEKAAQIKQTLADLDDIDAKIEKAKAGVAMVEKIGALGPRGWQPTGNGSLDGIGLRSVSGGEKKGYLSFRELSQALPYAALKYSGHFDTKGLVPSGESLVPVPIVNTQPIAGDAGAELPPRLLDYIPAIQRTVTDAAGSTTAAPAYDILVETTPADRGGASVVAPGEVKPTVKFQLERRHETLKVVAVLSEPLDKYMLQDAGNINAWMGDRLTQEVYTAVEREVVDGDGTAQHFTGLNHAEGVQEQDYRNTMFDTIASGVSKLERLGIPVSMIAMNPDDWLDAQTFKDAEGRYYLSSIIDAAARKLYGYQVVSAPSLTKGTGWVIGANTLTLSHDGAISLEWDRSSGFDKNQLQARVEGRFNLDILKPHGLVKLQLTKPTTTGK